jgi:DNA (cytosine-5)-methyltransferase 1
MVELSEMKRTRRKSSAFLALDLFSGCGGLTLGLKDAGFKVLAAVEIEKKAQETFEANHRDVRVFGDDIRNLCPTELMSELGITRGELSLLAGCPPCQGFSRLRTRNKTAIVKDDRNDLIFDFLRFAEETFPKMIMMENVPGLMKDKRFVAVRNRLERTGYETVVEIVDAADYGVPQRRKRLILLGSRLHAPKIAPPMSVRSSVRLALGQIDPANLDRDGLHAMLQTRSPKVAELIRLIPKDGGSRSSLPESHQLQCHKNQSGFNDVYGRMKWDDVSPTITSGCFNPSKGRFLHPHEDRAITLREAAVLQGFPIDYKFNLNHGKEAIALMIGNALPPPLIKAHAMSLLSGLQIA